MSALTRSFTIPCDDGTHSFEIKIHEPALTSDNLGLKTWAASYLLAKRLVLLSQSQDLLPRIEEGSKIDEIGPDERILELGSGTGLVGMAAAYVLKKSVVLSDLPVILPNLRHNAQLNAEVLSTRSSTTGVRTAILDWSEPTALSMDPDSNNSENLDSSTTPSNPISFPLILAADSIYSPTHPLLLTQTIKTWLSRCNTARVVTEFPLRECYAQQLEDFRREMGRIGLGVIEEGEEVGFDDWVGGDGERMEVRCWWAVWGWME